MATKLTAKPTVSAQKDDTYVVVTQTEGGVNSVRRMPPAVLLADDEDDARVLEYYASGGEYIFAASDMESGYWAYSTKSNNTKRLRDKRLFPVRKGMKITYTNPTMSVYLGVLETKTSQTYKQVSGWKSPGASNAVFNINYDGLLVFCTESTAAVTPEDYDCTVTIRTAIKTDLDAVKEIDATLSEPGKAAEAAAVGEAIDDAKASSLALRTGTAATIPNGTDYDTLTTPGNYRVTSADNVATMTNCPISVAHRMVVMTVQSSSAVFQIIISGVGKVYMRMYYNNAWSDWVRDLTTRDLDDTLTQANYPADAKAVGDAIDTIKADFLALRTGYASVIPDNTDYDTLTTPGNYRVTSPESVATMVNCPISTIHRMVVMTAGTTATVLQILIAATGKIYLRRQLNGSWNEWSRDLTTLDLDTTLTQTGYPAESKAVGDAIAALEAETNPMSYVKTEADRVADKVRSVQTTKSFTFVAVSDMHYKVDDTSAGNGTTIRSALRDMKDGVKCIASQIHIDFYACFGDIIWRLRSDGNYDKGYAEAVGATKILNECFGNNPQIRMIGNHDPNCEGSTGYFSENLMNSFTGLYNSFLINDSSFPTGALGYYDFEERKVRLIVLNTSLYTDNSPPAQGETQYMLGNQQMYWMAQHLDLSGKTDAQDWQIVIMSHVRLDGNEAVSYYNATQVFKAYVNGSTWTRSTYSYNFAGKNDAKLAVYFCGHSHMYEVSNLQTDYNGTTRVFDSTLPLAKMFIPNALPDRDVASMDGVTYEKTANSAASTSFLVITIDFDAKVVYGHHYGAGIDIILHYDSFTASSGSPLTLSTNLSSPAWGTMDADIAAVNSGAVTPVAAGDVVIFAKSSADNTIEAWNVHSEV